MAFLMTRLAERDEIREFVCILNVVVLSDRSFMMHVEVGAPPVAMFIPSEAAPLALEVVTLECFAAAIGPRLAVSRVMRTHRPSPAVYR